MARGGFSGFINTPKTATGTKAETNQYIDIVEKTLLNTQTAYGKVNTGEEADRVITGLRKLGGSMEVQERILKYENEKLGLNAKINDLQGDKDLFVSDLETTLKGVAQGSYNDIQGRLIPQYAEVYTDAASQYEDILSRKIASYGNAGDITGDSTAYLKELKEKADFYNQLANGYVWPDENGKLGANINASEIAVLVDTNPGTGRITRVDIVSANTVPKDYLPSDVTAKTSDTQDATALPMYLRAFKTVEDGKILYTSRVGDNVFKTAGKGEKDDNGVAVPTGILKFSAQAEEGRGFFKKLFRVGSAGDVEEDVASKGLDLSGATFDAYDIPDGALVKIGSRTFAQPKQGELYEITGKTADERKQNLGRFLTGNGLNEADVKTYYASRDFIYGGNGESKIKAVIDESYFKVGNGTVPGGNPSVVSPTPTATTSLRFSPGNEATGESASFFSQKNRPIGLDIQTESSTPAIVEKGKGFFRKLVGA